MRQSVPLNRRSFLKCATGVATSLALTPAWSWAHPKPETPRRLAFHNLHTGEALEATFWADGRYRPDQLAAINHLLRDHRSGEVAPIDPALLEVLHRLQHTLGFDAPYRIISGYRSPRTNAQLRQNSKGVAKKSLHMQGRAVDIRVPEVSLGQLHRAALDLRSGGVGFYPRSGFVHLDVGRVRQWRG